MDLVEQNCVDKEGLNFIDDAKLELIPRRSNAVGLARLEGNY